MKRKHFIGYRNAFMVVLTLVVSLSAPLRAGTVQAIDAGCTARAAEACPLHPGPNPLLSLAAACAIDLQRNRNCCVHRSDGSQDYAITKDCDTTNKSAAYLLLPVKPVTGMDDQQIFDPPFVDLWEEAWLWSREFPGQPASRTALAINSAGKRSQQQLHIHISCVDPAVSATLEKADIPWDPAKPRELRDFGPRGHTYQAVKVRKLTGKSSPFRVVMRRVGKRAMQQHGIAVIGSQKSGEYYVLATSEEDGGGHAEDLLNQRCEK